MESTSNYEVVSVKNRKKLDGQRFWICRCYDGSPDDRDYFPPRAEIATYDSRNDIFINADDDRDFFNTDEILGEYDVRKKEQTIFIFKSERDANKAAIEHESAYDDVE